MPRIDLKKHLFLLDDGRYRVIRPYSIGDTHVPEGFISNGASIPKMLHWLYKPDDERHLAEAVAHDWAYSIFSSYNNRQEQDILFAKSIDHSKPIAALFYLAVRVGGKNHWKTL